MKTIFLFEWKLLTRNKIAVAGWGIMLLICMYALYYGNSFQYSQFSMTNSLDTAYQNRVDKQLHNFSADTSTVESKDHFATAHDPFMSEWYVKPMIWKKPMAAQALSIGQADNQSFYNTLWLYWDNIYTDNPEIRNPEKLLVGNFDLAFFIVYLLPLFIIGSSYNLVSEDRDNGIEHLLKAQGISLHAILRCRLLFRIVLVFGFTFVASLAGFLINGAEIFPNFFYWIAGSVVYILFWFTVVYSVLSINITVVASSVMLVSLWVVFLLLTPTMITVTQRGNDVERLDFSDAQREYYGYLWGIWQEKSTRMEDTLFTLKPEWKQIGSKDTETIKSVGFSYIGMLHMNRLGWTYDSAALAQQQQSEQFNYINPAYTVQGLFNKIAASELSSFITYRQQAIAYQRIRNETVNQLRISGKPLDENVFRQYPQFLQPDYSISLEQCIKQLAPLILLTFVFLILGELIQRLPIRKLSSFMS